MTALELVREVRDGISGQTIQFVEDDEWISKLDAALAELERDQAFIQAAAAIGEDIGESLASAPDGRWFFGTEEITEAYAKRLDAFYTAYRARREERGKHGEVP